ncbi:MAG: hypothetical protein IKG18_11920 [Atopobiaceae bacterium]|nr:hypothetical protein [Atopobiaceae bacterium]
MSVGTIATSILTDIANAIRYQAGVATLYKPRQMAAAILALDGTDAGGYVPQQYKQVESGVLSSGVLDDMADAIRAQNGTQTQYAPGDMAQAILDLTWDTGVKIRAMLLTDGTLEFNYRDGRSSDLGTVSKCWEVDPAGYSSAASRPWDSDRMAVTKVAFDSDFSGAGMTNFGYFFHSMQNLVEVEGFEELSGATNVSQLFTSCTSLETVWATGFDGSAITSATYPFNGCARLVGQTGFVPTNSAGKAALSFGASGVLTNPANDQRTWAWAHLYERGVLEITSTQTPDSQRQVLASGRVCTNAHYQSHAAMPWYAQRTAVCECEFLADLSVAIASLDYWFYGDTNLSEVTGWANVDGLSSMRQTFNGCTSLALLDLSGLDPSSLTDYFYSFAGCTGLVTIFVDSTWALASGASGMGTFYNCTRILGGNGTTYSSSAYGYARMVIDRAGQAGYLTEA